MRAVGAGHLSSGAGNIAAETSDTDLYIIWRDTGQVGECDWAGVDGQTGMRRL